MRHSANSSSFISVVFDSKSGGWLSYSEMGKSAHGKQMKNRRLKRYERLNPVYDRLLELKVERQQHSIDVQSGKQPETEAPPVDQWANETAFFKQSNKVHDRDSIDADVEELKAKLLPY